MEKTLRGSSYSGCPLILVGGRVRCCLGERREREIAGSWRGLGRPHLDVKSMITCSDNAMGLRCTA